jgi:hypothetical protein
MSTSTQIVFKKTGPAKNPKGYIHGEALAYLLPKLNQVTEQLGLTSPDTLRAWFS